MVLTNPLPRSRFEERDQHLAPWMHYYNFTRPHGSLGYVPPISRAAPLGTTS
jgi:transposase InsO family protein